MSESKEKNRLFSKKFSAMSSSFNSRYNKEVMSEIVLLNQYTDKQ